jgi:hypothetical protein
MITRVAEPLDAERVAALHLPGWQEAYAGTIEPRRLAAITADLEGMVRFWRTMIDLGLRWPVRSSRRTPDGQAAQPGAGRGAYRPGPLPLPA